MDFRWNERKGHWGRSGVHHHGVAFHGTCETTWSCWLARELQDRGWRLVAPLVQTANSCEALRGHSMNATGI